VLRHQLNILRRKSAKRPTFGSIDRLILAGLYGLAPKVLSALAKRSMAAMSGAWLRRKVRHP
jgi:hypothetical protein